MQRIVVARSATLTRDFSFTPTGTPTVVVRHADGTTVTTGAVTATADPSVFEYTIPASQIPRLDELSETWTAVSGGESQVFTDTIEVAGGVLFSVAQARQLDPLSDTGRYPDQAIIDARTLVESALEDACGVAFVPRYKRETVNGTGFTNLVLASPRITAIRSASLDGTDFTVDELATVVPSGPGVVYTQNGWTRGFGNYTLAYEHGWPAPPPRVTNAALLLARRYLVDSPVSDRATSLTTDDGTTQFLVTAGVRQAVFDIPEANAVVQQYSLNACVA